ncbi:PAS domain-containing protein [Frigidibacter sp. MR17.24]|uniref:PAS domain-containing protein n=1 Tax=Frigidibacter sp. MR17.24 TaxID=3127345 RepID=UPI003012BCCA
MPIENAGFLKARGIIERSAVALTLADLDAPDAPLLLANAKFEALTGFALSQVQGRNCRFLQSGDLPANAQARADIRHAIEHREELQVVLKNHRRDGRAFDNLLFLNPVRLDGRDYMLGSQFELAELSRAVSGAPVHAAKLSDDLSRIAEKADRIQMSHRRHLADTAAFLVSRWAR